jgi:putative ABC transport system permease protein
MNFILKMAWRDSRASRRRLFLSSLSIVCGIAALVALGSLSVSLEGAVHSEAKGLLGADLVLTSRTPFSPGLERRLGELGAASSRDVSFSSMLVFPGAAGAARLVQVRAMEGAFPFYGDFVTDPASAADLLHRAGQARETGPGGNVIVLEPALMSQYDARVGDQVRLGRSLFTVAGALEKIPGESVAVTLLAPRAFIPLPALAGTGLLRGQSLVRYRIALKLPPGADPDAIGQRIREEFPNDRLGVETAASRERDLGRTLTNIYGYLSLVGFIALLLGAIGVASAIHVYVRQKTATVAILRCLGAGAGQAFAVYLAQGVALGVGGAVLGAAIGVGVQLGLPALVQGWLPFPVAFHLAWGAVARGMGAGLAICVLFTLLPLLGIRRVSPLAALRSASAEPGSRRVDPWAVLIGIGILAAVTAFAVAQTHSRRLGVGFSGVLAIGFGALYGLARLVAWAARRWPPRRLPYVLRQGFANLHRPNNRTVLLLLSLGLGTFLMLTLALARTTLLAQIRDVGAGGQPNLMFFDVQDDQIGPLDRLAAAQGVPVRQQAPIVTMKIAAIGGRGVDQLLSDPGYRPPAWTVRREYRSTYRDHLTDTERLTAGTFVGRVGSAQSPVPISVEEGLFRDMRLKLGDEIDWDVQGVTVRTRVGSVRSVEWRRLEPNFFVVFPAGALEGAPQTFVAALRADSPADSARVQRAVASAFPGVSAIDLTLVLQTLDSILGKIGFAIQFMALFTVATGLLVLAAAVAGGRTQRIREAVLLRTLGATGGQLARIQFVEYAVLGLLGALVGAVLAVVANELLARYVFEAPAADPPLLLLSAAAAVTAVTLGTGWLSNRGVARHPPLETLRSET